MKTNDATGSNVSQPLEEGDRFFVKVEEAPDEVESENGGRVVLYFSVHGREGRAARAKLSALTDYLRGGSGITVYPCVETDKYPPMVMVTMTDAGQAQAGLADEDVIDADYVMADDPGPTVLLAPPTDPRARLINVHGVTALEVDKGAQHYVVHNGVLCSVGGSYFNEETRRRCGPREWCRWTVNPQDNMKVMQGPDRIALDYFNDNNVEIWPSYSQRVDGALLRDPGPLTAAKKKEEVNDVKLK